MAATLSRQPWVRPQSVPLPRALSHEQGLSAVIAEGDAVQLWSEAEGRWLDGVAREVAGDGSVRVATPSGSLLVPAELCTSLIKKACRVSLVAPGGGVDGNGSVYLELDKEASFQVDVLGRKSTLYDCYPEGWQGGREPPNLASFAQDLLRIGAHERTDCFIFGSRGGQVVLPTMWQALGDRVPPSVVINGGCAMNLPGPRIAWPKRAATVMLMAGQDFFRGSQTSEEYLQSAIRCVAPENCTTAILYVPEMKHMPQPEILGAVVAHLVLAALVWRGAPHEVPLDLFKAAGSALEQLGFGSRLLYAAAPGRWHQMFFGPQEPDKPARPLSPRIPRPEQPPPTKPLGTAVAALPISVVMGLTPARHRELAAQAEREAEELSTQATCPAQAHDMHQRLLELAAGQEGEAYAMEGDLMNEKARKAAKAAQQPAAAERVGSGQFRATTVAAPTAAAAPRQSQPAVRYQSALPTTVPSSLQGQYRMARPTLLQHSPYPSSQQAQAYQTSLQKYLPAPVSATPAARAGALYRPMPAQTVMRAP